MKEMKRHLTEDDIIWVIIDQEEVSEGIREHLAHCELCSNNLRNLQGNLARVGGIATDSVQVPPPRPIFEKERRRRSLWQLKWGALGLSAALAGVLAVIAFVAPAIHRHSHQMEVAALLEEMRRDTKLMVKVDRLIENPLPSIYEDVSGEEAVVLDGDFMDFVVPKPIPFKGGANNA